MNLWNRLRLKLALITKSTSHGQAFMDHLYKQYLNHNKVIHWRKGYPVFSGSTPPAFSKPAANFLARKLMGVIQNRPFPNLMSFAVNDICNAKCEHCSFFEGHERPGGEVLNTEEAISVIHQAQDLGVSVINFVGGEPLLREDLPELIKAIDKDKSCSLLFTNGSILPIKIKALAEAGLDTVYLSIDSADPAKHNEMRGVRRIFEKGVEGLQMAKKLGLTVGLSVCVYPDDLDNGNLDAMMELGKKIGVHEIIVFDAMPAGRMKNRKDLMGQADFAEQLIKRIREFNEKPGYPGILSYTYATSYQSTGCCGGTAYFYVTPYGEICCCDFNPAQLGTLREYPLWKVWDNARDNPEFKEASWGGCKTKDPVYRAAQEAQTTCLPQGAKLSGCANKGDCGCSDKGGCGCKSGNSASKENSVELTLKL